MCICVWLGLISFFVINSTKTIDDELTETCLLPEQN